jgi:UDP-N-acetyl-D-glucosamine dehydrogenase
MSDPKTELLAKLESGRVIVGIVGMGYVGLPLALAFAERSIQVIGFDVDAAKVEALHAGQSYLKHVPSERIQRAVASGMLRATSSFDRLSEPDAILIAVPTPLTKQREPDMQFVQATVDQIKPRLRRGHLVVLESTTYPGTTDELVRTALDATGLALGTDYFLAFSPEREDPGNATFETATIPKVVGGVDAVSGQLAARLYSLAVSRVVPVASARAAEAVKLTENIFRAVNIALVNELKVVYDAMGIDVWDVIDAAATKPFGYMKFTPGPGLGGHCIPIDPFYLTWKAREYGLSTRFIELAGEINVSMPRYVVDKLQNALNQVGKPLRGAKVLMLGLAYKRDVDDSRESPSFELMHLLIERGAEVTYHDPHVPTVPPTRHWASVLPRLESYKLTPELLEAQDVVLIATDHTEVNYELVARHSKLIVDTRGVYRRGGDNIVKA